MARVPANQAFEILPTARRRERHVASGGSKLRPPFVFCQGQQFFTEMAIPGWTSDVFGSLAVVLLQGILATGLVLFIILGDRGRRMFLPVRDCPDYLDKSFVVFEK